MRKPETVHKDIISAVKTYFQKIDWKLLLLLILLLNVKFIIKLIAIVVIYCLRFNLKFGFNLRSSRLPLFYVSVMVIAAMNWLINQSFMHLNQNAAFITGLFMWLMCILAVHQIKLSIENNSSQKIDNTILAFFVLNAIVSFFNYAVMVVDSGSLNPFLYQGQFQKYFMGAGDRIRGITFDTSTTNAIINALGVIYFLYRKQIIMTLVCMTVLLFTASNLTNFLMVAVLIYVFIFQSDRWQKSIVAMCLSILLVFIAKISPQNNRYVLEVFEKIFKRENKLPPSVSPIPLRERPDSVLSIDEHRQKIALLYLDSLARVRRKERQLAAYHEPEILPTVESFEPNIHTLPFQRIVDTTAMQEKLMIIAKNIRADSLIALVADKGGHLPGKALACKQTIRFFKTHPEKLLIGTGMGNFSSKLAFRTTALNISGGYPNRLAYIDSNFRKNHFAAYVYFFSRDAQYHSIINTPDSVYNQLVGEYGAIGIIAFILLYLGFFLRRAYRNRMTVPLLILVTGVFFFEYWFEQLSIVIIFELLILTQKNNVGAG